MSRPGEYAEFGDDPSGTCFCKDCTAPDPDECPHENRDYDEGNYVASYGWEIYPGWYCLDCGEMLDEEEVDPDHGYDPDLARKYELEDEMRNPL